MNLDAKILSAQAIIRRALEVAAHPVLMWSGGKDSMVLLHLLKTGAHHLPVLHHRDGEHGPQFDFADRIIAEWKLQATDYVPLQRAMKQRGDRIECVSGYDVGHGKLLVLPKNLYESPTMSCGKQWLTQPTFPFAYPWTLALIGHKSSDVDEYEGAVPLRQHWVKQPGVPDLVFPLHNWTDDDIWEYTRRFSVPQDEGRYEVATGAKKDDLARNNDYRPMCIRCLDRNAAAWVPCPKLNGLPVENVSAAIPRLDTMPDYIGKD